jgi:hypothetical protein
MMPRLLSVLATIAFLSSSSSAAQQAPDLTPYLMSDRAAEIALARSAAPKNVSDSATVLVLTRSGYVEAARGTNGFTCFVQHSFDGKIGSDGFWDPTNRGPICLNPPAVRTVLPEMVKRAEWIMTGVSTTEIANRTRKAYASHEFPMPAAGAMAFMLSPEQHLSNTNPHWVPHLMFWYDKSMSPAMWGVGGATNTLIDGTGLDPDAQILTLLIPVRRWSDGQTALPETAK